MSKYEAVPVPASLLAEMRTDHVRPPTYPWATMKVNEGFEVAAKRRSSVLGNGARYAKRYNTGHRYISRKLDNGNVMIVRIA